MAQSRISQEELEQLTSGMPGTQEMTLGKALVNALRDTLGYAVSPGNIAAQITNKQALQKIMRAIEQSYSYKAKDYLKPQTMNKQHFGTKRALAKEIQDAPEGLFQHVDDIRFDPNEVGAYYEPANQSINIGPGYVTPKTVRHELTHAWQREWGADPDVARIAASSYKVQSGLPGENYYTGAPIVGQKMEKYLGPNEPWSRYHSVAATELTAKQMEAVPLNKVKSLDDYVNIFKKSFTENEAVQAERMRAARRFQRLARLKNARDFVNPETKPNYFGDIVELKNFGVE